MASSSCRLIRRTPSRPAAAPPPTRTATIPEPPPRPEPPPPEVPVPPELAPSEPQIVQQETVDIPKLSPPEPKKRARTVRQPAQESAAEARPQQPALQLQQILTPEQQRESNEAINQSISRAQLTLSALNQRTLTKDQATSVERIRSFIAQAEQARKSDLLTARALAERADVLAQDLQKSVR